MRTYIATCNSLILKNVNSECEFMFVVTSFRFYRMFYSYL